jgi:hypothetical protein
MAIGEVIEQEAGKVTGMRVLPEGALEVSAQGSGKVLGIDSTMLTTFSAQPRPAAGVLYGEGGGIITTKEGDMATFRGSGVGRPKGSSGQAASWRYSVTYQTNSQKLNRLNGCVCVGEFEVDDNGNFQDKQWEWK